MWAFVLAILAQAVSQPPPVQTGMWAPGWTVLTVAVAGGLMAIVFIIGYMALQADIRARHRRPRTRA